MFLLETLERIHFLPFSASRGSPRIGKPIGWLVASPSSGLWGWGHPIYIFIIFPGHLEFWTPITNPYLGPPSWLHPVTIGDPDYRFFQFVCSRQIPTPTDAMTVSTHHPLLSPILPPPFLYEQILSKQIWCPPLWTQISKPGFCIFGCVLDSSGKGFLNCLSSIPERDLIGLGQCWALYFLKAL